MQTPAQTLITHRWLPWSRIAWIGMALLVSAVFLAALPVRLEQQLGDPYGLLPSLGSLGLSIEFFTVYGTALDITMALGFVLIAALAYWRKPGDWMVLLVSLTMLGFPISILPVSTALAAASPTWNYIILALRGLGFLLLGLMLYLFPNGQFVPAQARWAVIAWVIYPLLWPFFPGIVPPAAFTEISTPADGGRLILVLALYGSGIALQAYRYLRVSTPVERQQTKWVVYGLGLSSVIFAGLTLSLVLVPGLQGPGTVFTIYLLLAIPLTLLGFLLLPLTIVIAISRERLWDIDVLIRRTLVYGLLTGLLAAIYFATIVLLTNLLTAAGGRATPVITVVSTLVIAALFSPLRRRIQEAIDRRFYRQKYDAEKALADFSLIARDDVDLENLSTALLKVVDETIQPESASIWLREVPKTAENLVFGLKK